MIVSLPHAGDAITAFFASVTDVKVASVAAVIAIFAITWPLRYQRNAALLDQAALAFKRLSDLPESYPDLTWWRRALRLRKRL